MKRELVRGQRGALCPSPPWRWQLAWLFFSRQPVFQEVRMGSSPRSPTLCPVTSPLPALGQPAAADDRCDETVVITPPGDSPGAEEDSPPGVQEQAHRSPCLPQGPATALPAHPPRRHPAWGWGRWGTAEPKPGARPPQGARARQLSQRQALDLGGNQSSSPRPSMRKQKRVRIRESPSQTGCLSGKLWIFYLLRVWGVPLCGWNMAVPKRPCASSCVS